MIFVELADGRIIGFSTNRLRILKVASEEELKMVMAEVRKIIGRENDFFDGE